MLQLLWEIDVAIRSVETWAGKQNGDKEKILCATRNFLFDMQGPCTILLK